MSRLEFALGPVVTAFSVTIGCSRANEPQDEGARVLAVPQRRIAQGN